MTDDARAIGAVPSAATGGYGPSVIPAWELRDVWFSYPSAPSGSDSGAPGEGPAGRSAARAATPSMSPTSATVLQNLSLSGRSGEFVTLLGPSGCGKSTVLRLLAGIATPASGDVRVAGTAADHVVGRCAYQPQGPTLLPWKTCLENAVLGATVAGVDRETARRQATAQFARFGLRGYESAWPSALSGGMAQRLALLRAFLMPGEVLLLDEPLGALDAITRRELQLWLEGVWEADGRTVVMVTHDLDEALLLSDRVLVLSARPARVVADVPVTLPRTRTETDLLTAEGTTLKTRVLAALRGSEGDR